MSAVRAVSTGAAAPAAAAKEPSKAKDAALKRAAEEFEGVLLRQILQTAKIGGKGGEKGYGAMAVDALATGLQAGGGLGLARAIEQALSSAQHPKAK
jgi:Rod binding domain-containing protein